MGAVPIASTMAHALIIVDVQYDFLPSFEHQPNHHGALAVPNGGDILNPLYKLAMDHRVDYKMILASYDWHPKNHMSFIDNGGVWPEHCVQNTFGADLEQMVIDVSDFYVEKGGNPEREAYSAFEGFVHTEGKPTLPEFLEDEDITQVDIVGLALDFCVKETALSALVHGFYPNVFLNLTRPVTYEGGVRAIAEMVHAGVDIDIYTP